ncbi:Ger(x)C family spore germination protein [Paenibacillus sp. FSL M8-0334]|uniref:Ger(x)C family spore germination protein n=1 Tax=Paenibacillus sp. FSL M8-0334 TaxID=2921623 RepID=UPI0030F8A0A9
MSRTMRIGLMLTFIVLQVITTGCWGHREIEDQSVYIGLGLDVGSPSKFEQEANEQGGHYPKMNTVTVTVQIAPAGSSQKQGGQGSPSSGSQGGSYQNQQLTGDSILQVFRQFALRNERPLVGLHLKVVVVSSELAKQYGMGQIFDSIFRDNDIRESCLVMISHGKASEVLNSQHPGEIPAFRLRDAHRNRYRNQKILPPVTLVMLENNVRSKSSFMLQNIVSAEGEQYLSGAAIIKGETNKWVGELSEAEVEGLSWITEKKFGGVVKTYTIDGRAITYEIKNASAKVVPIVSGDDISFQIKISSEGRLIEDWSQPDITPQQTTVLQKLEEKFEEQARKQLGQALYKLQNVYHTDAAGFGEQIRISHPKVWKKVKDNWDDIFSHVPISYDIKMTIIDYGSSKE